MKRMRWGGFGVAVAAWLAASSVHARALDHLLDKSDIGSHKIPHAGTSRILVIPVHVGPEGFDAEEYAELQAEMAEDGPFRRYWLDVSGGRYDPVPTLAAPVEYPDSCPIPGRTVDNCTVTFNDTDLLAGGLREALADVLARVRDDQQIDLAEFDVNNAAGDGPDGYFDGVIAVSNIAEGVSLPLVPIFNETTVKTSPGGGGTDITLSLLAMAPPIHHEFAHMFGFIDLYGGPTLNGMMSDDRATLSAFSRQQVGWADITVIDKSVEIDLPPVLSSAEAGGNQIIRVNLPAPSSPTSYLLIENRGGPLHDAYEPSVPGVQIYSVDEATLAEGPLHFIDIVNSSLNLPNAAMPYMNVSLPLDCDIHSVGEPLSCAMALEGEERALTHASGVFSGWTIRVVGVKDDGTITIQIFDENGPPVKAEPATTDGDGGCNVSAGRRAGVSGWLLLLAALALRSSRRAPKR